MKIGQNINFMLEAIKVLKHLFSKFQVHWEENEDRTKP